MAFFSPDGNLLDVFLRDEEVLNNISGGKLKSWGIDSSGNLGLNVSGVGVDVSYPTAIPTSTPSFRQVVARASTVLAIKTDNTLWAWGASTNGLTGLNSTTPTRSSPTQVGTNNNWMTLTATSSGGSTRMFAIKTDGTLWSWGQGISGVLGNGDTFSRSSPTQVGTNTNWKIVTCTVNVGCAIKTDGTLWTWGFGQNGDLGDNTGVNRSSPVQVGSDTNWKLVSGGSGHIAAIKTDGTLWMWGGQSTTGVLGDDSRIDRSSPVQSIAGGSNWKFVNGGLSTMGAIKTDGTLWMWGLNLAGQIGDNTAVYRSSPVQTAAGGNDWRKVLSSNTVTIGVKSDGTLWQWGKNAYGMNATGAFDSTGRSSPVQLLFTGNKWRDVVLGQQTSTGLQYFGLENY